ncbi:MAG: ShlB/FhaC/HecB family hemolysin secretion/activation protein, partial [Candidatus Xenobia bacterium]
MLVAMGVVASGTPAFCDPVPVPPLTAAPAPAAPAPSGPAFQVTHINVTGTSVIPPTELNHIIAPHEGKSLTLADLKMVADQITQLYRSKGYFLAKAYVPAQPVVEGVARIDVLEGRVGKIKVVGNKHYSSSFIASRFEPLVKGKVVNYDSLERAVRLLNENMDLQATVSLQPGQAVGSTDLLVTVKDQRPDHLTASYNNYGNNFVGPNRGGLQYEDGNVTGHGDYLSISGLESFPAGGNVPYVSGAYIMPLTDNGAKLGLSYSDGLFLPGDTLSQLNITSQAEIGGLTYTNPINRSIERSTNFSTSFFTKSFNNTILGNEISHDEIRELQFGYDGSWFYKTGGTTAAFH